MAKKAVKEDLWKRIFSWKKLLIAITLIVIITFLLYNFGYIKKTCEDDYCFQSSLASCSPAKYIKLQNMNYYRYSIMGYRTGGCKMDIKLVKMADGTPIEKILKFEGKDMACEIPRDDIRDINATNIEKILPYCSGTLKEAMYEHIIEKLYTIVISNLGDVIGEIRAVL